MKCSHQSKNQRHRCESGAGFTIIEMLVVVSIIAVLPLVVVSNFPRLKLQFNLTDAAHEFAQQVRNAQDAAISSLPYKDVLGVEQPVSGYGIYVNAGGSASGNTTYLFYADKSPGNQQYDDSDYIVSSIDISTDQPGIIIKELRGVTGNIASIHFKPPNPITVLTELQQGFSAVEVVFALASEPEKEKVIKVHTSGLIEVK